MRRDGRFEDETECHKSHKFCQLPPSLRCRGGFPDWESAKKKENFIQSRFWKKSAHVVEHRKTVSKDGFGSRSLQGFESLESTFPLFFFLYPPYLSVHWWRSLLLAVLPWVRISPVDQFKGAAKWLDVVKNWVQHGKGLLTLLLLRNAPTLNSF